MADPVIAVPVKWDGTNLTEFEAVKWDGTDLTVYDIVFTGVPDDGGPTPVVPITPMVSQLPRPFYLLHRGSPEEVLLTYQDGVAANIGVAPGVYALADDTLVLNHDATVDRTWVTGTGQVLLKTIADWQAGVVEDLIGSEPDQPAEFWSSLISEFSDRAVMAPEAKTSAMLPRLIDSVTTRNQQNWVIVRSYIRANAEAAAAAGLYAMLQYASGFPGSTELAQLATAGVWGISVVPASATQTNINAARAAGLKVWAHGVTTVAERDTLNSRSIDGIISQFADVIAPAPNPPTPGTVTTRIGACPIASEGGTAAAVITKWGTGAALRTFTAEGGGMAVAPRPAGTSKAHHSWKPSLGTTNSPGSVTEAQIVNALQNYQDDDIATIWHETPVKLRNGSFTQSQALLSLAMQNDVYAKIKRLRELGDIPMIWTCFIDAGWMWDSQSGLYPGTATNMDSCEYWLRNIECDLLGIDTDAYQGMSGYPNFATRVLPNIMDSLARFPKFTGWTIPEIMHPRISSDATGSQRATWITQQVNAMLAQPIKPHAIHLFDTDHRPNQVFLEGSPEYTAFRALVAQAAQA